MAHITISRSDCEDHFRFLDLPAELRNRIYHFTTETEADFSRGPLLWLGLAQTCQQLRTEYRPICMEREITLLWGEVTGYLHAFFPNVDDKIENAGFVPKGMTIVTQWRGEGKENEGELDLLPIVKVGLCRPDFTCRFVHDKASMNHVLEEDQDFAEFIVADSASLEKVLCNRDEQWQLDIANGVIKKIIISNIGVWDCPWATFYMDASAFDQDSESSEISSEELYFKGVGLHEAWEWSQYPSFPRLSFEA